jgi:hypothetical protein
MARRLVQVDQLSYLFSSDDPPSLGERTWALARARVVDELTGEPPEVPIGLEIDLPAASPRVGPDGLVGVVAAPRHVYPTLAARGYAVQMTVDATGFIPLRASAVVPTSARAIVAPAPSAGATVLALDDASRLRPRETLLVGPPGPTLASVQIRALGPGPNEVTIGPALASPFAVGDPVVPVVASDFAPTDLGEIALHREPTVVFGRTVRAVAGATVPLAGATVRVTGVWRTPPPASAVVPPDPPNLVSLRPPLYADRAAVVGRLLRRNLPANPDPIATQKRLLDDVPAGVTAIRIPNRVGIAPGNILRVDDESPDLVEYVTIATVVGLADPTRPATVTLDTPLAFDHRAGALVERTNPQPLGGDRGFAVDAIAGDSTVFLSSLSGLTAGDVVRVTGGPAPNQYHDLRLFSTLSDADGYYRLAPISRVAQLELRAESGVLTPVTAEFRPDYRLRESRLDFIFQ